MKASRIIHLAMAAFFVSTLAACGGGDESPQASTVPTTGTASLQTDEASAKSVVTMLVSADDQAAQSDGKNKRLNRLTSNTALASGAANIARATKQINETLSCANIYPTGEQLGSAQVTGCSGTVSVASNLDQFSNTGDLIPAGAFFTIGFNQLSVQTSDGSSISMTGSLTMTIIEAFQQAGTSNNFVGAFELSFSNLAGIDENGDAFGPESGTIVATLRADGSISYVIDGVRVDDMNLSTTNDPNSYTINTGTLTTGYGDGYAQVTFQNWNVVNGVPQVGSSVVVTGANGQVTATVSSINGNDISFTVVITTNTTETHQVNATITGGQVVVN